MTNPNDILDAYDELVRLVDIIGPDTLRQLVDRACGRTDTPARLATVTEIAQAPEPSSQPDLPASELSGCPWCGFGASKHTMFRHVNARHRSDLEQLYVEDGVKGIQDVFGIPYQTAYGWATRIDEGAA